MDLLSEDTWKFINTFAPWFSALGTLLAVLVALYLALRARKEFDIGLSQDRALKCARMVQRVFEFDPDNPSGENLQVDLYSEFDIQLSMEK